MVVGRYLVAAGEEEVLVLITKLSHKAHRVLAGAKLGMCVEVECQEEQWESEESATVGLLPGHLQDLVQMSASNLTEVQAERMHHLMQYSDMFSQGDLDLGRTGLVKHWIHIKEAQPIKHTPRKIAPARQEMQQVINELAVHGVVEQSDSSWSPPS